MSKEIVIAAALAGSAGLLGVYIERRRMNVKEVALIAALSAIAALGRLPFAAFPGVQPTTFIVVVSGAVLGPSIGLLVGALAALVSNMFLGQGPWTVFQLCAWGLCGLTSGWCFAGGRYRHRIALTAFGAAWGFVFGWIVNLWHWLMFVHPLGFRSWLAVNAASVWFDSMHALCNAALCWAAGREVIAALRRFKNRMAFSLDVEQPAANLRRPLARG